MEANKLYITRVTSILEWKMCVKDLFRFTFLYVCEASVGSFWEMWIIKVLDNGAVACTHRCRGFTGLG